MKHIAALLLLGAAALPASGQHLTKQQEALMLAGQCYSACAEEGATRGEHLIRIAIDAFPYVDEYEAVEVCVLAQEWIRVLENCAAGCQDIERAHGVTRHTSWARARFFRFLSMHRAPLRSAGLWTDYRNSPTIYDTNPQRFAHACARYSFGVKHSKQAAEDEMRYFNPSSPDPWREKAAEWEEDAEDVLTPPPASSD